MGIIIFKGKKYAQGTDYKQIYPIGKIIFSTNSENPSVKFGGTWEEISGKFLYGTETASEVGTTGGSTEAIIPRHRHAVTAQTTTSSTHSHSYDYNVGINLATMTNYTDIQVEQGSFYGLTQGTVSFSGGAHTHTKPAKTTNSEGSEETNLNMPPYLSVYIWRRVA